MPHEPTRGRGDRGEEAVEVPRAEGPGPPSEQGVDAAGDARLGRANRFQPPRPLQGGRRLVGPAQLGLAITAAVGRLTRATSTGPGPRALEAADHARSDEQRHAAVVRAAAPEADLLDLKSEIARLREALGD